MKSISLSLLLLLGACIGHPDTLEPVKNFQVERFSGTWYEIARLPHAFEHGLHQVTATYTLRPENSLGVLNRGYRESKDLWKNATGSAYLVGDPHEGHLRVSVFGPLYSSFVIFDLDPQYRWAYASGYNTDYLWLLAREPEVSAERKMHFQESIANKGFDASQLIWVRH